MIDAMLCQSGTEKLLDDPNWIGELKADGTRVILSKVDEIIKLVNREGIDYTTRLTEIVESAKTIPAAEFVLDGEAVWFDHNGRTKFVGSQVRCSTENREKQKLAKLKYPIVMLSFDLLQLDGRNIEHYPLLQRKQLLQDILKATPSEIRALPWTVTEKRQLYEELVARGEEGLILKRLGSRYEQGRRSSSWRKVKKWYVERCKVVGYTEGTGKREKFFGSLILAQPDSEGYLRYVGKVGTGFNDAELRRVFNILKESEVDDVLVQSPDPHQPVKADLEVTVKFYETTDEGVYRFPSMLKDHGVNQIHFGGTTIEAKPRPMDLKSLLESLR